MLSVADAENGKPITKPMLVVAGVIGPYSADGMSFVSRPDECTVQVRSTMTGRIFGKTLRRPEQINGVCISPDGKLVAIASGKTVRVWDTMAGIQHVEPITTGVFVRPVCFNQRGTQLVVGEYGDNSSDQGPKPCLIWDVSSGRLVCSGLGVDGGLYRACFSADDTKLVTSSGNTAIIREAATGRPIGLPMRDIEDIYEVCFDPGGTMVLTLAGDIVRLWDANSGASLGLSMRVKGLPAARFSADGRRVLIQDDSGVLRTWNLPVPTEIAAIAVITPPVLTWAQQIAGLRINDNAEFEPTEHEEPAANLISALPPGPWSELATWLNSPAPWRTTHPGSKMTLRELAVQERDFQGDGTVASLESALRCDPSVPLGHLLLGAALEREEAEKKPDERDAGIPQRAAFLRRFSLEALQRESGKMPDEPQAALWLRAAKHLAKLPAEAKVGIGSKEAPAREEAVKAARRALELVPGMREAEELLRTLTP